MNEPADVTITVKSVHDAPNTKVELLLPEGIKLVSGDGIWNVDLTANTPVTFSARIMLFKTGSWEIKAVAKKVIDAENIWGDMDIAYIGFPDTTKNATGERRLG